MRETNPFRLDDFVDEKRINRFQSFDIVETKGFKLLEELIRKDWDAFIVGEAGIGKSITAQGVASKLSFEGYRIYKYVGERNLVELYNEIWILLNSSESLRKEIESFLLKNRNVRVYEWVIEWCKYFSCRRKERCYFKIINKFNPEFNEIMNHISSLTINCPMKRYIIFNLLQFQPIVQYFRGLNITFIIDVPTIFSKFDVSHFSELIYHLRNLGKVIILADINQYQLCQKSKDLIKLRKLNFPFPSPKEVVEIIKIKAERSNYTLTLTYHNLLKLSALSSLNPRKMLAACDVYDRNLKCFSYLPSTSLNLPLSSQRQWIKVKQIYSFLKEQNIDVTDRAIGKILKKEGYSHRCNPDSEYFINLNEIFHLFNFNVDKIYK